MQKGIERDHTLSIASTLNSRDQNMIGTRRSYSATIPTEVPMQASLWDWLVDKSFFKTALKKQGYFILQKDSIGRQLTSPLPPFSTSFDFLSQMPAPLRQRGLYVIRTGRGNCVVFDSKVFGFPFGGGICTKPPTGEIDAKIPIGYRNLVRSLTRVNEQSFLRLMHFFGIFGQVARHVSGTTSYETGPSGHLSCTFPFWMKGRSKRLVEFSFEGISDLDECLYPRNRNVVIPIEAKIDDDGNNCDIGWHKIAFPCYRFIDNSLFSRGRELRIVPVYCVYKSSTKKAEILVFPQVRIHTDRSVGFVRRGLVLNEGKQFSPTMVLTVDMSKVIRYG